MKILTITCHRPHNYGAVLQTFALNHYLRASGYDARVIDYTSKSHGGISDKYKNNPFAKIIRSILLFPDKLKGKNNFGKFLNNFEVKFSLSSFTNANGESGFFGINGSGNFNGITQIRMRGFIK
jgi:hypothetical protein